MALVILAHPNYAQSIANKNVIWQLKQNQNNLEIRNIYALYPDYQIDYKEEQAALSRHNLIVLQYPLYWFNMPAILKVWFDQVFTYQFAYGSGGDKLKDKYLLPSVTVGQPEINFIQDQHHLMTALLSPIKKSAQYTRMHYIEAIFLYDVSTVSGHKEADISHHARLQGNRLSTLIKQYDQRRSCTGMG